MKIDFKYFAAFIVLIIVLLFILVLFNKIDWETAIAFAGPAIYTIYSEWKVNNREKAFKDTNKISYELYKKRK